jgi:CRISPR type IV-associated protein Csf3
VIPLTITAHLGAPVVPGGALYFDGLLLYAVGCRIAAGSALGLLEEAEVLAAPLPLARVETPHGWWWAASAAPPAGREQVANAHRRPMVAAAELWTSASSIGIASGPDKALRVPLYYRPEWPRVTWTCVGDPVEVTDLLRWVSGLGRRTAHGWGWVTRWDVVKGGPPLEDYASRVDLRHVPCAAVEGLPAGRVLSRDLPLRPPYWSRDGRVRCWQVPDGD